MKTFTASNLVNAIGKLHKNQAYNYAHDKTTTKVEIVRVDKPEGPIIIKRYDPFKGEGPQSKRNESISIPMIWRVANAISEGRPINIDRVLGASYNTRSALEALLLHTPEFYKCRPGRVEVMRSIPKIKSGHKHIIWLPNDPHTPGSIYEKDTDLVVSDNIPDVVYDAIILPETEIDEAIDIEVQRLHARMQVAIVLIGNELQFRTWVALNDKGIKFKDGRILGEMEGVIPKLENELFFSSYGEAVKVGTYIDCIWISDEQTMPAVIEIEHSTGVTSGLSRMRDFCDRIPPLKDVRCVIAAPDEDRHKVLKATNKPQFSKLDPKFLPYSAIEELLSLCQKRGLRGATHEFIDNFLEPCIE
jgi:type II restriction enzyme